MIIEKLRPNFEERGIVVKTARNGAKKLMRELTQAEINEIPFLKEFISEIKNPKVILGIKDSKDQAVILGVVKSNDTPIVRAAVQVANAEGEMTGLLKARASVGKDADAVIAAADVNTSKNLDISDLEYNFASKKGTISVHTHAGDAFKADASVNASKVDEFCENYVSEYADKSFFQNTFQSMQQKIQSRFSQITADVVEAIKKS